MSYGACSSSRVRVPHCARIRDKRVLLAGSCESGTFDLWCTTVAHAFLCIVHSALALIHKYYMRISGAHGQSMDCVCGGLESTGDQWRCMRVDAELGENQERTLERTMSRTEAHTCAFRARTHSLGAPEEVLLDARWALVPPPLLPCRDCVIRRTHLSQVHSDTCVRIVYTCTCIAYRIETRCTQEHTHTLVSTSEYYLIGSGSNNFSGV